jgi:hypothetical protein
MKTITTVGFDKTNPPRIAYHTFTINAHGLLEHVIDDQIRALVPPEGFEAYCEAWPDARQVIPAANTEPA